MVGVAVQHREQYEAQINSPTDRPTNQPTCKIRNWCKNGNYFRKLWLKSEQSNSECSKVSEDNNKKLYNTKRQWEVTTWFRRQIQMCKHCTCILLDGWLQVRYTSTIAERVNWFFFLFSSATILPLPVLNLSFYIFTDVRSTTSDAETKEICQTKFAQYIQCTLVYCAFIIVTLFLSS